MMETASGKVGSLGSLS